MQGSVGIKQFSDGSASPRCCSRLASQFELKLRRSGTFMLCWANISQVKFSITLQAVLTRILQVCHQTGPCTCTYTHKHRRLSHQSVGAMPKLNKLSFQRNGRGQRFKQFGIKHLYENGEMSLKCQRGLIYRAGYDKNRSVKLCLGAFCPRNGIFLKVSKNY